MLSRSRYRKNNAAVIYRTSKSAAAAAALKSLCTAFGISKKHQIMRSLQASSKGAPLYYVVESSSSGLGSRKAPPGDWTVMKPFFR